MLIIPFVMAILHKLFPKSPALAAFKAGFNGDRLTDDMSYTGLALHHEVRDLLAPDPKK